MPICCRMCGNRVKSKIHICRACYHDKIKFRYIAIEKAEKQLFNLVTALYYLNFQLEKCLQLVYQFCNIATMDEII